MRRVLAAIGVGCALGACSLIYNPSNLPGPDAFQFKDAAFLDAPRADADPQMITVTKVSPSAGVFEGQGVGSSRPAILTLEGSNFVPGVTVSIAPTNSGDTADLVVGDVAIAGDGNTIAVPVTANIMTGVGSGKSIPLTITVSESGFSTTTTWTETALDELTDATLPKNGAVPTQTVFSQVDLTADATFKGTTPVILHSMSTIQTGAIHVDASGATGGPGGCAGGASGSAGACPGGGAGGSSGIAGIGATGAGGGGFAMMGGSGGSGAAGGGSAGDPFILAYATNVGAGGGGGGPNGLGTAGGVGGGGGGTIELHAEGTLTTGALTANGAAGASGAANGGGGAGGVIVIRTAASMSVASATAGGGAASGSSGTAGGSGSPGRMRFDAPAGTIGGAQMGPSFDPATPLIATSPTLSVSYRIPMLTTFTMTQLEADGSLNHLTPPQSGTANGNASLNVALGLGWNQLCLQVPGGAPDVDLQNECIEIAYITK